MSELSANRRIERKELISLFAALPPGAEIAQQEVEAAVGLDLTRSGDKNLCYDVREHCRDVLGIVIKAIAGKRFRRMTDDEIAGDVIDRRRDRIYRQSVRGIAETTAPEFGSLDHAKQVRLLAHQSIFGAIALASHSTSLPKIEEQIDRAALVKPDPEQMMRAVAAIEQ
jgi:hypothetical protein